MARNFNKEIARHILAAQIASDMAKYDCYNSKYYYSEKDFHIKEALKKICESRSKVYRFSVHTCEVTPYLVYFTVNIPGEKRLQISFHSFSAGLERYSKSCKKTYWDKHSARVSAEIVADYYNVDFESTCNIVDTTFNDWQDAVEWKLS